MLDTALVDYQAGRLASAASGYDAAALQMRRQLGEKLAGWIPRDAFDSKPFISINDGAVCASMAFVIKARNYMQLEPGKEHRVRIVAGRGEVPEKHLAMQFKRTDPKFAPLEKDDRLLEINGCQAFMHQSASGRIPCLPSSMPLISTAFQKARCDKGAFATGARPPHGPAPSARRQAR